MPFLRDWFFVGRADAREWFLLADFVCCEMVTPNNS